MIAGPGMLADPLLGAPILRIPWDRVVLPDGNFLVLGTGPHSIGTTPEGYIQINFGGDFTSDGSAERMIGINYGATLTGAAGDTTLLFGVSYSPSIVTQTATESITDIVTLLVNEPQITDNLTGSITNATTVKIQGAPTEGTNNYALWVTAGGVRVDGDLLLSVTRSITASVTQTQGQQALTSAANLVETVANANEVVTLPSAVAGLGCEVVNAGANTLQIFPASGDAIQGNAVNTSVTLAAGNSSAFRAYDATDWYF